jgi:hypothetical protein
MTLRKLRGPTQIEISTDRSESFVYSLSQVSLASGNFGPQRDNEWYVKIQTLKVGGRILLDYLIRHLSDIALSFHSL